MKRRLKRKSCYVLTLALVMFAIQFGVQYFATDYSVWTRAGLAGITAGVTAWIVTTAYTRGRRLDADD